MSSLHFTIRSMWVNKPVLFILLVTIPLIIYAIVMIKNRKSTNQIVTNTIMIFWILLPAAEAYVLNNARKTPTKGRFGILFIVICAAFVILVTKLDDTLDAISAKSKAKAGKKRMMKALTEDDYETFRETVNMDMLAELKDPVLIGKAIKFTGRTDSLDKFFYSKMADMTDRKTAHELINDPECAAPFVQELYIKYPEEADYSNPDRLIQIAFKSPEAAGKLRNHIMKISDPQKFEQAMDAANVYSDQNLIKQILPNLTYPDNAGVLRKIVTSVKTLDKQIRKQAFAKIPAEDEAFTKSYCPYCGATDIKSGYMGLQMDMYWYGYRCLGCGHTAQNPEGMGEASPFTVPFSDLVE